MSVKQTERKITALYERLSATMTTPGIVTPS